MARRFEHLLVTSLCILLLGVLPCVAQPGGDGSNAWMNLGGRDVRLQQIRSLTHETRNLWQYYYRFGELRVSVVIEPFKPENAPVEETDSMFKMKITLRRGRAVRVVRAVGDSDC